MKSLLTSCHHTDAPSMAVLISIFLCQPVASFMHQLADMKEMSDIFKNVLAEIDYALRALSNHTSLDGWNNIGHLLLWIQHTCCPSPDNRARLNVTQCHTLLIQ